MVYMNRRETEMNITHEKSCWHEIADGNRIDPSSPYCDLAEGHAGRHRYVCGHEMMTGGYDDPTFAYCHLPAFHAGDHIHNF